jgi:deazaflavin-dependent oxidoreductase (nitroreductase family)
MTTTTPPVSAAPSVPSPAPPALAAPPADGAVHGLDPLAHRLFKVFNRWFMIPVHRAGLGAWVGSPVGGYMLLLRVRGRKSGLVRETPLSYLVAEGSVWVVAGFGPATEWYRNLLADPRVEVRLPTRRITGTATEVRDPGDRERVLPAVVRATGLPAFLGGVNPWTATDGEILDRFGFVPLIRIDADGGPLEPGPDDPGGTAWVWRQLVVLGVTLALRRGVAAGVRRLLR